MLAPVPAIVLLLTATVLLTPACRGHRPFELPPRTGVPAHPCADWGVTTCEGACNEQSDGNACLVASVAYAEGITVRKDVASMQALERRACDLGVALACEHYANNFWRSDDDDERDRAREHYERACQGGRVRACSRAGFLALRIDADGEPQDARAALELFGRACEGGESGACSVVGDLSTFGIGTRVDLAAAEAAFRKACDGRDPAGCHNLQTTDEHWLTGAQGVLLEPLHHPDPVPSAEHAPSGWHGVVVTRTCFTHESLEPVRVHIVEPSGRPLVDVVVRGTLYGWRYRTRPGWTLERPVCIPNVFDIHRQ